MGRRIRWRASLAAAIALAASAVGLADPPGASADHTAVPGSVALVGSLQSELGCPGDWQPECAATELQPVEGEPGIFRASFDVPAGVFEYKVALNDSWAENYYAGGVQNGPNIALNAPGGSITFTYDHATHVIADSVGTGSMSVALVGSLQSELGCPGDWQPECAATELQPVEGEPGVFRATFDVPAGVFEYKASTTHGPRITPSSRKLVELPG